MSTTELIKALNSAISALPHGRLSTTRKKVALVDAELNPNTSEIVFTNTSELIDNKILCHSLRFKGNR
jgi:hypothetical protein